MRLLHRARNSGRTYSVQPFGGLALHGVVAKIQRVDRLRDVLADVVHRDDDCRHTVAWVTACGAMGTAGVIP